MWNLGHKKMVRWHFFGISDFLKWDLFWTFSANMECCVILAGFLRANGHTFSPYFCLSLKVSQKWRNTFFVLNYNMNSPNVQGPLFFSLLTFLYELQRSEMQKALKMFSSATPSWTANWIHYYSSIMNLTNQFLIGG